MLKTKRFSNWFVLRVMTLVLVVVMSMFSGILMAGEVNPGTQALSSTIQSTMATKSYELREGGFVSGDRLFKEDPPGSGVYSVDELEFSLLSDSAKNQWGQDLVKLAGQSYDPKYADNLIDQGVNKQTASSWLQSLVDKPGVGTYIMTALTSDLRPDFVRAKPIIDRFTGPINTVAAVILLVLFLLLSVSIVLDITYIGLPFFNNFVEGRQDGNFVGKLISQDAKNAYKEGFANDGSSGKAIMFYLGKRSLFFLALGLIIMLLIMGKMYEVVGTILDLFSGLV